MGKIQVDLNGLKTLLESAKKTGKTEQWADIALEWMEQANEQISKLSTPESSTKPEDIDLICWRKECLFFDQEHQGNCMPCSNGEEPLIFIGCNMMTFQEATSDLKDL